MAESQPTQRTPLAVQHAELNDNTGDTDTSLQIRLAEHAPLCHLSLRARPTEALQQALQQALDVPLPVQPNSATHHIERGLSLFWRSPDETLLLAPKTQADDLLARLSNVLPTLPIDLSCGQTVIELAGPNAAEVLAKGCTLDFDDPQILGDQRCAQTLIGAVSVLLWRQQDAFHIVVRRSFADHLWRWLLTASREYRPTNNRNNGSNSDVA